MQTPSSLSQSVIKGMRKAALETCCHHSNVVITTSSFPPGKNRFNSLLNSSSIYPPGSLFFPFYFLIFFLVLSVFFLPAVKSHSFISHSAFPTLHFSQLFYAETFSLPSCFCTLLLLLHSSTASTFKSEAKDVVMETNVTPDRLKYSCEHRNCRRCKYNLGKTDS